MHISQLMSHTSCSLHRRLNLSRFCKVLGNPVVMWSRALVSEVKLTHTFLRLEVVANRKGTIVGPEYVSVVRQHLTSICWTKMQPWTFKCFNWFRGRRARRLVSILQQAISINSRRLHFDSKHSTCSFVMSTSTMTSLLRFGKPLKSAGSRFRETEESCRHCKHEPSPEPNM